MEARKSGWVYAFAHFATEVICFYWLYRYVCKDVWFAIIYDVLAFVPQLFLGWYADNHPEVKIGPIGIGLLFFVAVLSPMISLENDNLWRIVFFLILTVGNCFVHVAGAEATTRGANGKMSPSGVFVGAGSFGLIFGRLMGSANIDWMVLVPIVLLVAAFFLTRNDYDPVRMRQEASGFRTASARPMWIIVLLIFLTVAVRAYIGYAIPTAWIQNTSQLVILYVFMGIGKMVGGMIADRIGARRTAVLSLLLALPLLIIGEKNMILSLLGVMLFSMTMSISYGVLLSQFPDIPGFAFGITTLGLSVGTIPAFFILLPGILWNDMIIIVLSVVAIVCFYNSASNTILKEDPNK